MRKIYGYANDDTMTVYGYTEEKDLIEIVLSIDEIVAAEIDPFRLDLCDPDPVIWNDGEHNLRFRRLQDISFVYEVDGEMFVGSHDGHNRICLRGTPVFRKELPGWITHCNKIVISDRPFAEHWAEYLRRHAPSFKRMFSPREFLANYLVKPATASGVVLQGDRLMFETSDDDFSGWPQEPTCVGEMLNEVTAAITLPPSVNAAFEIFSKWTPIVHDRTIWDVLSGKEPESVRVSLTEGCLGLVREELADYSRHLGRMRPTEEQFHINGVEYCVKARTEGRPEPWPHICPSEEDWWSIDHLESRQANQVTGLQISWFDIAKKQARPLMKFTYYSDRLQVRMSEAGIQLISFELVSGARSSTPDLVAPAD